jgi:hypothetical protein
LGGLPDKTAASVTTPEVYTTLPAVALQQTSRGKNCVDIADNRTQYLVVATLLPLEMGNGFGFRPCETKIARGKIDPGGISCQQRKRQRKRKRNINRRRESFSLTEVYGLSREAPLEGFFVARPVADAPRSGVRKIWVVPGG